VPRCLNAPQSQEVQRLDGLKGGGVGLAGLNRERSLAEGLAVLGCFADQRVVAAHRAIDDRAIAARENVSSRFRGQVCTLQGSHHVGS